MHANMFQVENILLRDNSIVTMRRLQQGDAGALYNYLSGLSVESRSRFGPHAFDKETVYDICRQPDGNIQRYITLNGENIIAYMLLKKGMIDADAQRYSQYSMLFEETTAITYAPSVADQFQNSGLGSKMFAILRETLKHQGYHTIILWGGVQATNARAVHFYEKHGFRRVANFWHDNIKSLFITV
jgi:ribosomal protein S18 acetylase RimI-like enzyme